jgi:hypothetical protein
MSIHRCRKRPGQTLGLMVSVLLTLVLASPGVAAGVAASQAPRVFVANPVYDFGKVMENQALTHTFIIKNSGNKPLKIKKVDPDCACTATAYDRTIPPRGQGKITLTIKPYSVLHRFEKKTRVSFNDPEASPLVLTLKGEAQLFVEIEPSHIVRFRGSPGQDLQAQVRFVSHLPGPWEITKWNTNIPDKIDVSVKAVVPGKVYVVTVKNKCQQAGVYAGLVNLYNTSPHRPRLLVRVFAKLSGPSGGGPTKK